MLPKWPIHFNNHIGIAPRVSVWFYILKEVKYAINSEYKQQMSAVYFPGY